MNRRNHRAFALSLAALSLCACIDKPAAPQTDNTPAARVARVETPDAVRSALAANDRVDGDRALDANSHIGEALAFFGLHSGQTVGQIIAGSGYYTEVISRVVGPQGHVFAQNPREVLLRYAAAPWTQRLARPALGNVVRYDRELNEPFPADVRNLEAVYLLDGYHEAGAQGVDRGAMHRAVFRALRAGGVYGIVGYAARAGRGMGDATSLARVEASTVISEVRAAGFRLEGEGDFARDASDARTANALGDGPGRGRGERFVLKFVRP